MSPTGTENWNPSGKRKPQVLGIGSMWLDWGAEWNAGSVFFLVVSLYFQRANTSLWIKQCCLLGTELEKHPGGLTEILPFEICLCQSYMKRWREVFEHEETT